MDDAVFRGILDGGLCEILIATYLKYWSNKVELLLSYQLILCKLMCSCGKSINAVVEIGVFDLVSQNCFDFSFNWMRACVFIII